MAEQDNKKLATYKCKIEKIKSFLKSNSKNMGPRGNERKSNITDPESAKMSTSHGVIQGHNGMAVVDEKHQIIVNAEAHASVCEGQAFVLHNSREIKVRLYFTRSCSFVIPHRRFRINSTTSFRERRGWCTAHSLAHATVRDRYQGSVITCPGRQLHMTYC